MGREGRKVVTALFADVVGSTAIGERLDPEDYRQVVGDAVARMVAAVEEYGGDIRDLAGDGVLAMFGAPVAHEDDPERAALAGLDILEAIADHAQEVAAEWEIEGFAVRVGIETGLVVLGPVGGGATVEFGAMGDTLNTAARLQSRAEPGGILVGPTTQRLIEPLFEWGEAVPLTLKGKADPVLAHTLLDRRPEARARRAGAGVEVQLTGRDRELAVIAEAMTDLGAGVGGAVVLAGEAGIGKSRLLAEARDLAADEAGGSPMWLEGRCVSYGESVAYLPFAELLRDWLGVSAGCSQEEAAAALREGAGELLGEREAELRPFLGTILGLPPTEAERPLLAGLSAEALHGRVFESLDTSLRRRAAEAPVVVAVDDAQFADPSSLRLLEGLLGAARETPLLIAIAMRVDPDHGSAALPGRATGELGRRARVLSLNPLGEGADRELLASLVGAGTLPEAVEDQLIERAAGNPFFLEELVRSLVDGGALARESGRWRFRGEASIEVPDTVEKLILSRVDRLDPPVRAVLDAAAILGREFDDELLEEICDPSDASAGALAELQELDLVRSAGAGDSRRFRFRHSMIQEATYGSLLRRRRRELHGRALEALEREAGAGSEERLAELARHSRFAGKLERAIEYHRRAGDAAQAIYASEEAIEHYSAALEVAEELGIEPEAERLWRIRRERGLARVFSGALEAGYEDLDTALRSVRASGDRSGELEVLEAVVLYRKLSDHRAAIALNEEALRIARELGDRPAQVRVLNQASLIHTNQLQLDRGIDLSERAHALAAELGDEAAIAQALDGLKLAAFQLGDLDRLASVAGEQARIHRRREDPGMLRWPLLEGAFAPLGRAEWERAFAQLSEAMALNARIGDTTSEPLFLDALAWAYRSRGEYERALTLGREAARMARERGVPYWESWTAATLGWTLLELRAAGEAAGHLEHGVEVAERVGNLNQEIRCAGELAWARWLLGEGDRAVAMVQRAEGLMRRVRCPPDAAFLFGTHAYLALAHVHLGRGEAERGESLIAPIAASAAASGWKELASSSALVLGRCRAERGDARGRDGIEDALRTAREAGLPAVEWESRAALSGLLRDGGEAGGATEHAEEARTIVERLAAPIGDGEVRRGFLEQALAEPARAAT